MRIQGPILIGDRSAPEPDAAVVPGGLRAFDERHPRADEAALVVEVTVGSYASDRLKRALYARGGAGTYWMVDVPRRRVEVL